MKKLYLFLLLFFWQHATQGQIYLNEFMALNQSTITDESGKYEDWIEIFNPSDSSLSMNGYYLTDDPEEPDKWAFKDITIEAKSYLILWADDDEKDGPLHTNFKLSGEGENLALFYEQTLVDSVSFGQQQTDVSYARNPDGIGAWYFTSPATPGNTNQTGEIPQLTQPSCPVASGFYQSSVPIILSHTNPEVEIYYTLDGSIPDENGARYSSPIFIQKATVLRAIAVQDGFLPSPVLTLNFFVKQNFSIPTMSLVMAPEDLWDDATGIYANPLESGDEWERPVSIEFFDESQNSLFTADCGIRIHGQSSREFEKKSFRLYFRSEYGTSRLENQLFMEKPDIDEFKRLLVHSGSADTPVGHSFNGWNLLRNAVMYELSRRLDIAYPAHRYMTLFLNRQPWGIYHLKERVDEYYLQSNFGEKAYDLLENGGEVHAGDNQAYREMIRFFEHGNLYRSNLMEEAKTYIDLQNYTDYLILNIYGGNHDWPQNNSFAFRPKEDGAQWRWLNWDMDACFNMSKVYHNTLEKASTGEDAATIILYSLLENEEYREYFITRSADLLNTVFNSENVKAITDSLAGIIQGDISFETNRWGSSPEEWWEEGIEQSMHEFANRRVLNVLRHISNAFSIRRQNLCLETPQGGKGDVRINTIVASEFPWTGTYFRDVYIELEALPAPGYRFAGWSRSNYSQTPKIYVSLYNDLTLFPIFEKVEPAEGIVINEINYNSHNSFDPEDWIEILNANDKEIDLSGWHFRDSDDSHDFVFPDSTRLAAGEYLVLCSDTAAFYQLFPNVTNVIGPFDFNLSNSGEFICLFDACFNIIDSLEYDDAPPWPTEADGDGATLALKNPEMDNALAESWQISANYGTPGAVNQLLNDDQLPGQKDLSKSNPFLANENGTSQDLTAIPTTYFLEQNYPNPFNPDATITFGLPEPAQIKITIYNLLGQNVRELLNANLPAGRHRIIWNATNEKGQPVNSGIYLCEMTCSSFRKLIKMTLVK